MALCIRTRLVAPAALDVAFEIRGFTALLGASGSGKTSLLKAIAGLLPSTGAPWEGLPARARPVGYLPQGAALFAHLSVLENAGFALRGADRQGRARARLEALGIGHLAARSGGHLSGGEAQLVALARALAREPQLLLLDEPTASLDAATRDAVFTRLIEAIGAHGLPALAATHDPAIAGLADWLVLLHGGRIIAEGTPRALFDRPPTVAAARLLGYRNFWRQDGGVFCIGAREIGIGPGGREAVIRSVRDQGAELRLICAMPEEMTVLLKGAGREAFAPGQKIGLQLPPHAIRRLEEDGNPAFRRPGAAA